MHSSIMPEAASVELFVSTLSITGAGSRVWLRVGKLFDGETVRHDVHLVYDKDRIIHADKTSPDAGQVRRGQSRPDLVLPEHTVLPGLIEAHAHLFLEGGECDAALRAKNLELPDDVLFARAENRLERLLRIGVTAVRDAGDRNGVGLALQRRFRSKARGAMPYVDSPGSAVHHEGRYGSFMGEAVELLGSVEAAIAARVAKGAHRIKLIPTGIINFRKGEVTARPQMPADEMKRAVAAARALERQTFAHCSGKDGVDICIDAEVDSIEHGYFVGESQLARMRDLGIAWVPTIAPVQFQIDHAEELGWSDAVRGNLQRIVDEHSASLVRAAGLGVRIVAGSDAGSHGVPHGHGLLRELELMEGAGLSAVTVLRAATGAGSERLGFSESFGLLRPGMKPRFILTGAPVLDSVRHLRKPLVTLFDGAVHCGGDDAGCPGM